MTRKEYDEYLYSISDKLGNTAKELSDRTVSIIAKRLKMIGDTGGEGLKSVGDYLASDLRDINKVQAEVIKSVAEQTTSTFNKASLANDEVSSEYYKAIGIKQVAAAEAVNTSPIIKKATKQTQKELKAMFKSRAFVIDGKPKTVRQQYVETVNKAIYDIKSGAIDYNTSIRQTVKKMSQSGIKTVDYASGYARRLDSTVRMNTLDAVRQMSNDVREEQGKEFGADGVEISSHSHCAPDHQQIDGKRFTLKEWEKVNDNLTRPLGDMGCKHTKFLVLLDISKPTYTNTELTKRHAEANKPINYTVGNKKYTTTGYEATQVQRKYELSLRKLKDERNALKDAGDTLGTQQMQKRITLKAREYKNVSKQLGLAPKPSRTR